MSPNATERIAEIGRIPPVLVAGFAVVSIALLSTLPTSPWEFDELLFVQGVVQFQPLIDHPAAPGYPLVIAAGKFMNFFFCRPFGGLVAVSVLSSMLAFLALALLFVRAALSQMDVPTRSSYVMAVVTPPERPAAASVTSVPRSLAAAASPAIAGALYAAGLAAWPFVICGILKIFYDLALLWTFRHVKPPEEQ